MNRMKAKRQTSRILAVLGFSILFFCTYYLLARLNNHFDYRAHKLLCNWESISTWELTYPAWHIVVMLFTNIASLDIAVALGTGVFNGITFLVCYYIMSESEIDAIQSFVFSLMIMMCGPLYFKTINPVYYLGQLTCTMWHNPTHIAVKGISLASLYMIYKIMYGKEKLSVWFYTVAALITTASIFFKPNYVQVLLPGVFIIYFIRVLTGKVSWKNLWTCFCVLFPSAIVLLGQVVALWGSNSDANTGSITLGWFVVWSKYAPHILGSILISMAFPLSMILLFGKRYCAREDLGLWVLWLTAFVQYAFLYEDGERMVAGNFGWGLQLMTFFVFYKYVIKLLQTRREIWKTNNKIDKLKCIICMLVFGAHTLCGVIYYFYILQTGTYR